MPSSRRPARPSGSARDSGARPPSTPRAGSGAGGAKKAKGAAPTAKGKAAPKKPSAGSTTRGSATKSSTTRASAAKGTTAKGAPAKGAGRKPAAPSSASRKAAAPRTAPAPSTARTTAARSAPRTAPARPAPRTAPARPGTAAPRGARPTSGGGAKRPTQPRRRSAVSGSVAPPARADRKRGSFGLVLPEVLTVRAMVLSVVVLLAVVLLLPTVRAVVTQQAELRELRSELSQQQVQKEELETELARWDDRSYVIEQARSRFRFVMPGDKVWRPLDTESVQEDEPAAGVVEPSPGVAEDAGTPWYTSVWDSVRIAGGEE
ncbi:septum formation initiator family protein [Promicromonospora vindobonensis]|uniref:Septum formation initiator family protein n=1 Tax=Promicromonospora vindobonensis TaxID=195748 RepID=A0ABW5VSY4_9MICO